MKKLNILLMLMCMFALSISAQEFNQAKSMYIFGVAFSLSDSTAYMTQIVPVDSTFEQKKTHFLYARNEYSIQLSSYAKAHEMSHPTTTVSFSNKAKKLQKKYAKMNARLVKDGFTITIVPTSEFKFTAVKYVEPEIEETTETKAEKKARLKAEKEARKAEGDKNGRPGMPPGGGKGGPGGMGGPGGGAPMGGMGGPGGGM